MTPPRVVLLLCQRFYSAGASRTAQVTGEELLLATLIAIEVDALWGTGGRGIPAGGFSPHRRGGHLRRDSRCGPADGGRRGCFAACAGLALSLCSGSMAFLDDGSWTKRLHPGWAASAALQAAALGVSGFEGPSEAYGGRFGFYALYAPGVGRDRSRVFAVVSRVGLRTVAIKPYPLSSIMRRSMRRWRCVMSTI